MHSQGGETSFHRSEGEATHELLLAEPAEQQDGDDARSEAAESLARNRPWGEEKEEMKAVSVPARPEVRVMLQGVSFQARQAVQAIADLVQ